MKRMRKRWKIKEKTIKKILLQFIDDSQRMKKEKKNEEEWAIEYK